MKQAADAIVIGGGVSGLTAAYELGRKGLSVLVLEQSSRLGGLVQTDQILGCTLEAGPDSFLAAKPAVFELATELGIGDRLLSSNDAKRRVFLLHQGRLTAMPRGMSLMTPTDLQAAAESGLFSAETLRKFEAEQEMTPRRREGDFSVQALVEAHFGPEVLETVVEPLLAGVYGGAAGELSAPSVLPRFVDYERNLGSLIRGAQSEQRAAAGNGSLFQSFQSGMGELVGALELAVRERTQVICGRAQKVTRDSGGWTVLTAAGQLYRAQALVLAVPAFAAASLLGEVDSVLAGALCEIPYSSAILCNLLFRSGDLGRALDGFGFLVPRREREVVAAATWINTKFPIRVADGLCAIRAFVVDPEATHYDATRDEELAGSIVRDLERIMGFSAKPVWEGVARWPKSMPQYVVGHAARMATVEQRLGKLAGLHLASNYLDGVGIPDCIRMAKMAASLIYHELTGPDLTKN